MHLTGENPAIRTFAAILTLFVVSFYRSHSMLPVDRPGYLKNNNIDVSHQDFKMSVDDKILSSDINQMIQSNPTTSYPYHTSICGSILYSAPTNSPSDIFSYLRHGNFDAFRRSLEVYHQDIIQMRNEYRQTVLHVLVIHAYQYLWIRLMMMRGCDTRAQDSDGYTAAHYAVERDDVEMLKALTVRFHAQAKPISDERITEIQNQCLNALTLKDKHGLTPFMLACHHESMKCLNYLIELNINDSHLEDEFGDTCLHYAVSRRNQILVEKLVTICKANVNSGHPNRPSVLDILQYNREQQKPSDRLKDDEIEQLLLSHDGKNRCSIRRVIGKRKGSIDSDEHVISNLACLSLDLTTNAEIETARSHARMAQLLQTKGDIHGAEQSYKQALIYLPNDSIEWATYAYHLALIYMILGQRQLALDLLRKAIHIRKQLEITSQDIDQIQKAIDSIPS